MSLCTIDGFDPHLSGVLVVGYVSDDVRAHTEGFLQEFGALWIG